ncbi:hypothetical protein A3E46_01470 [Candidatus Woesebacteria bacterium RIFCSPHIGHO2_12_FULL_46_16]|uniref:DUF1003 domain-containing protein n=1 Tax=Candidatus Woesebacteria bacterium RIFCSPHIGHO2_12_FULL_46_16 TaxID=1802513 RepID=A0A1F8AY07_9BACT|nr:MAG: hypothetical protein A3E46_01470 [Candidatus Woesebacteria bacterium RIFCSPHIGHO2_12_FULL_46_16]
MARYSHQIIESFEAKALKKRPFTIRIADWLTSSFGSIAFLLANLVFFSAWILINTGRVPSVPVFDPFPFILLTMAVSLEAIMLAIVVLMSQNRQSYISTLREELDMQVNLISEREITKVLKLLKEIRNKLAQEEIADPELEEMIKRVDTSYIERQLEEQLSIKSNSIAKEVVKPLSRVTEKVEKTILPNK